jgi:hypothetical protein
METTEKIVEAYVRYVKRWFTITNIRCPGQLEIDLLAIDASNPDALRRYHIETTVSISNTYSRLTTRPFSLQDLKTRVKQAGQRRTLGYFVERKFGDPAVLAALRALGFLPGRYSKIIVSWGWDADVPVKAEAAGVELWDFREILKEVATTGRATGAYFTDDTMRTLQLMALAMEDRGKKPPAGA